MSHNGCTITSIKTKANIFANHYGRVSKLDMSKADHDLHRHLKKKKKEQKNPLSSLFADDESCAPLQMGKLLSDIKKIKSKGATGPDNIPLSFLK